MRFRKTGSAMMERLVSLQNKTLGWGLLTYRECDTALSRTSAAATDATVPMARARSTKATRAVTHPASLLFPRSDS